MSKKKRKKNQKRAAENQTKEIRKTAGEVSEETQANAPWEDVPTDANQEETTGETSKSHAGNRVEDWTILEDEDEGFDYSAKRRHQAFCRERSGLAGMYRLRRWSEETDFETFASAIEDRVVGQKELRFLLMEVYLYLRNVAHGIPTKNNAILTAPSGCGKTETFRALRDYFADRVPGLVVYRVDLANITSAGFKGKDPTFILDPMKKKSDGVGIVFLDEFDKKLLPEYTGNGENVNLAVQNQLLCMIEGTVVDEIDTEKTMFIGCGSFGAIRKARNEVPKEMGFGAKRESAEEKHFKPITREEILEMGGCAELIGRFGPVINYEPLNQEALDRILDQIRKRQSDLFGREIFLGERFRAELQELIDSPFGVRLWESTVHEQILRAVLAGGSGSGDTAILIKSSGEYEFFTALKEKDSKELEAALAEEDMGKAG